MLLAVVAIIESNSHCRRLSGGCLRAAPTRAAGSLTGGFEVDGQREPCALLNSTDYLPPLRAVVGSPCGSSTQRNTGAKKRCREARSGLTACLNAVSDTRRGAPATGPSLPREIRLGQPNTPRMRATLACAFAAAAAALPSLRRRMAIEENQPREHTAIYVWDKAVWFAPHGHDRRAADARTRRRLGDYENDYEKPV